MSNPTDYTGGVSYDDLLSMFYSIPLAPIYREAPHTCIRPDGRVHGVFPDTATVFVITPDDLEIWREAYLANVTLFPLEA